MKKRFMTQLKADVIFAWRHGFYFVYLAITAAYVLIIKNLPPVAASIGAPLLIYSDPSIIGMLFTGAIILLEKQQGVLHYMMVTPLYTMEYILSKVLSMTLVALFAGTLIMILCVGIRISWGLLIVGIVLSSIFHALLGIGLSLKARTLNSLIVLCTPFILLEVLPIAAIFSLPYTSMLRVLPGYAGAALIYGSVHGMMGMQVLANTFLIMLWCLLILLIVIRIFRRSFRGGR